MFALTLSLVLLVAVYLFLRSRKARGIHRQLISVEDIGDVFRQISSQRVETSFAVFAIQTDQGEADGGIEIQFSVEDGRAGLDWILMSPKNIAEKQKVLQYGEARGMPWQEKEMNEWVYLRIEQGDVAGFCTSLIEDLYRVDRVELRYGGFRYKK